MVGGTYHTISNPLSLLLKEQLHYTGFALQGFLALLISSTRVYEHPRGRYSDLLITILHYIHKINIAEI
jgi:hypothetical protein